MFHEEIMMVMFGSSNSTTNNNLVRVFLALLFIFLLLFSLPFTTAFSGTTFRRPLSFQYPEGSTTTKRSGGRFLFSVRRYVQSETSSTTIIAPKKKMNNKYKKENALETCLRRNFCHQEMQQIDDGEGMTTPQQVVLFLDFNNIRGKSDFAYSHAELLLKVSEWMKEYHDDNDLIVICAIDHASKEETVAISNNLLAVFAGPDQTADDVIAKGTRWFVDLDDDDGDDEEEDFKQTSRNMIFVVTSDGELRQRCLRSNPNHRHTKKHHHKRSRKKESSQKDCVKVFSSFQFLDCLENVNSLDKNIDLLPLVSSHDTKQHQHVPFQQRLEEIERDIRFYESKRPPWSSRQEKVDAMASGPWKSTLLPSSSPIVENNNNNNKSEGEDDDLNNTTIEVSTIRSCNNKNIKNMTTGTDTSNLAKPFREVTWHRILIAESMRRLLLLQLHIESIACPLSGHILVERYQLYYRRLHEEEKEEESSRKMKKNDVADQCILWDDHRIRYDLDAQHYLRLYLNESFRTVNLQRDGILSDDGNDETDPLGTDDSRRSIQKAVDADTISDGIGSVYKPKTPLEEAVETLTRLVEESPSKTQDQILTRYTKEAPSYLQFSRRYDLQQLFLLLAIRERRYGDSKPQWYLRKQPKDKQSSSSSDNDDDFVKELDFYIQPGHGKRRKGRQRAAKRKRASVVSLNQLEDAKISVERNNFERLQADWFDLVT